MSHRSTPSPAASRVSGGPSARAHAALRGAFREEAAFRQELAFAVLVIPVGLWLGHSGVERALLIGPVLLILIVELLNSAIEATVDRIGSNTTSWQGCERYWLCRSIHVFCAARRRLAAGVARPLGARSIYATRVNICHRAHSPAVRAAQPPEPPPPPSSSAAPQFLAPPTACAPGPAGGAARAAGGGGRRQARLGGDARAHRRQRGGDRGRLPRAPSIPSAIPRRRRPASWSTPSAD